MEVNSFALVQLIEIKQNILHMKKIINVLFGVSINFLIFYLIFSFIDWDFNVINWTGTKRFFFIIGFLVTNNKIIKFFEENIKL